MKHSSLGKWNISLIVTSIFLIFIGSIFTGIVGASNSKKWNLDYTEGGHLETDFDAFFISEWWYLNGHASLICEDEDADVRDFAFFVVFGHTESPLTSNGGVQLSHLAVFHGLYLEDEPAEFLYEETYVPQAIVGDYISLHTPFVNYSYPLGLKTLYGESKKGYDLEYVSENMTLNILFRPKVDKTVDQSDYPLNFTTYESSYGKISGSVLIYGESCQIKGGEGYMDHMIPISRGIGTWPMDLHGWNWIEVTTENYQAVLYSTRSLEDGYTKYSYKHLVIINRESGKVDAEYSGDQIDISESGWIYEADFGRWRPSEVIVSISDGTMVSVESEAVLYFDTPYALPMGFVDFMAFQPTDALIEYKGNVETGSSFYEYTVGDFALQIGQ
jgi:hypothetical protein